MNTADQIKLFGMSHQMAERDLDVVEQRLAIDLDREWFRQDDKDQEYYPQFTAAVRTEAAAMAEHYEVFYCLEKSIRELVRSKLDAELGVGWWDTAVPDPVKQNVARNIERERDSGVTMRSTEQLDYTTFGELGEIVRQNWAVFGDVFNSEKAFGKIMTSLNVLRGPIAHCSPLAPDEVLRLRLAVSDW